MQARQQKSAGRTTTHSKTDIVVAVLARIVVAIGGAAIPRIVDPGAAASFAAYPTDTLPEKPMPDAELPIIQKTYDLIKWYVPILNQLPRDHKFQMGNRIVSGLYDLLETLIFIRYQPEKLSKLYVVNSKLDVLRYQTRLLLDFDLLSHKRYQYVGQLINGIGVDLGGWINQQQSSDVGKPKKPIKPIKKASNETLR